MRHYRRYSTFIIVMLLILCSVCVIQSAQAAPLLQQGTTTQNVVANPSSDAPDRISSPTNMLFSYQGQLANATGTPIANATLPMTFRLFPVATGSSPCWTEDHIGGNAVSVQNGLFHVLLGQLTAIPSACFAGDAYLELVVNGETLSPRELLTSVAFAAEATTLPRDAVTRGTLNIRGDMIAGASGEEYIFHTRSGTNGDFLQITSRDAGGDWKWSQGISLIDVSGYVGIGTLAPLDQLHVSGNASLGSRLMFREPTAIDGSSAEIGIDASTAKNFAIFDYLQRRPMFKILGASRDVEMYGSASVGGDLTANGRVVASGLTLPTYPSSGVGWSGTSSALGRAANDGHYSVDSRAGDLVLRPAGGARLILARGEETVDHPAAIVIDGSDTYIKTNVFISGSDLVLYGRNSGGTGGAGRALVDGGSGSGLIINYGNDYGSWRIEGPANSNLNLGGHSIANCGALVEANLQTPKELASDKIDRFGEGDLLCWGIDQLELCTSANDPLVQAVADSNGRPIVLGAEKVKVLGPVKRGNYLVTSDVPGYAIASDKPIFGIVIAQALEDFAGERGLIKAMIRKM